MPQLHAVAAHEAVALDDRDLLARAGRLDRSPLAGGTAAQHHDVVMRHVTLPRRAAILATHSSGGALTGPLPKVTTRAGIADGELPRAAGPHLSRAWDWPPWPPWHGRAQMVREATRGGEVAHGAGKRGPDGTTDRLDRGRGLAHLARPGRLGDARGVPRRTSRSEPAFHQGDEVAVRLAFERGAPTFATTARVAWIRPGAVHTECSLMWSASPAERQALEAWILAGDRAARADPVHVARLGRRLRGPGGGGVDCAPYARRSLRSRDRLGAAVRRPAARDRASCRSPRRTSGSPTSGSSWSREPSRLPVLALYTQARPEALVHAASRLRVLHHPARRALRDLGRRSCSRATCRRPRARTRSCSARGALRVLRRDDGRLDAADPAAAADEPRAQARRAHRGLLHLPGLERRRLPDAARRPAALPRLPAPGSPSSGRCGSARQWLFTVGARARGLRRVGPQRACAQRRSPT